MTFTKVDSNTWHAVTDFGVLMVFRPAARRDWQYFVNAPSRVLEDRREFPTLQEAQQAAVETALLYLEQLQQDLRAWVRAHREG